MIDDIIYALQETTYEGMILHIAERENGKKIYIKDPSVYQRVGRDQYCRRIYLKDTEEL